jgi:AcrR family transcriptional regulator
MYSSEMSRPINEERFEDLRSAIIQYLLDHGITNLSLRPLAKAVRSSPRALLYHFGSKEKLVISALGEIRQRQLLLFLQIQSDTFIDACLEVWNALSSPSLEKQVRLFFELYGIAVRQPALYKEFLTSVVGDWLEFTVQQLRKEGVQPQKALSLATIVLAGLRGFLLDLCATQDRERINQAVFVWVGTLQEMVTK